MSDNARPLANRVALVTAFARGIGAAVTIALARRGAHIIGTVRAGGDTAEIENALKALGAPFEIHTLDMTDPGGIAVLATKIRDRHGRLDVLVGNAGVPGPSVPLTAVAPRDWDEAMAVNLTANWHLIRYMDALLQASDAGRLVFVSSGSAARTAANRGPYSISKAALEALARTYANETKGTKLRVNLFNPGPIRTRMRAQTAPHEDPMTIDTPEQAAESLVQLCLPTYNETGKLYDHYAKGYLEFRKPFFA